jgi:hypothetical protein
VNFTFQKDATPGGDDNQLFRDVTFGANKFCAVGGGTPISGSSKMARWAVSSDGKNWMGADDASQWLGGVVYAEPYFVAVGGGGRVVRSQDCKTWEQVRAVNFSAPEGHLRQVVLKDGILVAIGDKGSLQSKDKGVTWSAGDNGTGLARTKKNQAAGLGATVSFSWMDLTSVKAGQTKKILPGNGMNAIIFAGNSN